MRNKSLHSVVSTSRANVVLAVVGGAVQRRVGVPGPAADKGPASNSTVGVMPHTLVLSPLCDNDVSDVGGGASLEGALLVRNFCSDIVEVQLYSSSPALTLAVQRVSIAAHDDARYCPNINLKGTMTVPVPRTVPVPNRDTTRPILTVPCVLHVISVVVRYIPHYRTRGALPETDENQSPAHSGHIGYIMASTTDGEDIVVEVKRPSTGNTIPRSLGEKENAADCARGPLKVGATISDRKLDRGGFSKLATMSNSFPKVVPSAAVEPVRGHLLPSAPSWPSSASEDRSSSAGGDLHQRSHHTAGSTLSSSTSGTGVYFRRRNLDFGEVGIGSLSKMKIELCNASENDVSTCYCG